MKKEVVIYILVFIYLTFKSYADFEFSIPPQTKHQIRTIELSKEGILFASNENTSVTGLSNGLYFDYNAKLEFQLKALKNYLIEDIKSDDSFYYVATKNSYYNQIGLFKISKDFSQVSNIGIKAAARKVLPFKNKVYTGGTVHGCYVVNKDGSGLTQVLGDGYTGPYIDDLKANSTNVFILSRGQLYKVDYLSNNLSQIYSVLRPSSIEVDDEKIYASAGYQFYHLSFDGKISNQKNFQNNINFIKKYKDYIFVVESSPYAINFWASRDKGLNFYKSNFSMPAAYQITNLEISGENPLTVYINTNGYGLFKGSFIWDFEDLRIFNSPFKITNSRQLKDKITSFFDHKYPFLGNKVEDIQDSSTTLNFDGKSLPKPYLYYSSHDGTDFGLPMNTPINPVLNGTASYFYQDKGLGHAILVSHPNGYITIYGHLSENGLITKSVKNVTESDVLGYVGMSGNTNGPHLHFTVYKGSKILENKVDPYGWNSKNLDPWSLIGSKSKYLWKDKALPLSYQFNQNQSSEILIENINLKNKQGAELELSNLEIEKSAPIYDQKNYDYRPNTSYNFRITDYLGNRSNKTIYYEIKFKDFESFSDEKRYSIWKLFEGKHEKLETKFDPKTMSLTAESVINESDLVILKDKFKKIKSSSIFKTN